MKYNFDEQIERCGTACEKYDSREAVFGNGNVIPLWVADMDFRVAPEILDSLRRRIEHGVLGYPTVATSCYHAVASWVKRRNGWDIKHEWITFCPGVVPALSLSVQAFTKPHDKVLIQSPVYPPFFSTVRSNDRTVIESPLLEADGYYTMDFDDLDAKLKDASLLILCNPHNPVGRAWKRDELMRLGELCVKHGVTVLSDEIHADLLMPPHKHTHFASLSPEIADCTITFMAASKSFNIAGLSLGVGISSNPELLAKYNNLSRRNFLGENTFGLLGLEAAFNHGEAWLGQLVGYLSDNADYVVSFIREQLPKVRVRKQEATYLMWVDFRNLAMSQDELVDFMVNEAGLGLNNGRNFGENGAGFMRLNLACPRATLEKAMEQLKAAYDSRFA